MGLFWWNDKEKIQKWKKDPLFNTEEMMPLSEIRGQTLILKDGGMRAILKVEGLNLDLKNYDEQQIVLEQYKRFLNGLNFPVQILIRNTYLDLSDYLNFVRGKVESITNPVIHDHGDQYVDFLTRIDSQVWLIFIKEFYIIVPYYVGDTDASQVKKPRWSKLMNVLSMKDSVEKVVARYRSFVKNEKFLNTRCAVVADGLQSIGVSVERMGMSDMISLLFRSYNPTVHGSQWEREG